MIFSVRSPSKPSSVFPPLRASKNLFIPSLRSLFTLEPFPSRIVCFTALTGGSAVPNDR